MARPSSFGERTSVSKYLIKGYQIFLRNLALVGACGGLPPQKIEMVSSFILQSQQ